MHWLAEIAAAEPNLAASAAQSSGGVSPLVIVTIQSARASSTRSFYDCKWRVDVLAMDMSHSNFLVRAILSFLQNLIDKHADKDFSDLLYLERVLKSIIM